MRESILTHYGTIGPITGSILHPGDVRVLGSVLPGFEVVAGGSVLVSRDVRDARIVAGGDVAVNGLVSGPRAVVDTIGTARLKQVADARVIAGNDVEVRVAVERSELAAGRHVRVVGEPGVIRGGHVRAGAGVECFRLEAAAGEVPEIEIGSFPFEFDPEDLRERIRFAREREVKARELPIATDVALRRRAADLRSYRVLVSSLVHRLRQAERSRHDEEAPWLTVTGAGRVRAKVRLGSVEDALRGRQEQWTGSVKIELSGDEARAETIGEAARVG